MAMKAQTPIHAMPARRTPGPCRSLHPEADQNSRKGTDDADEKQHGDRGQGHCGEIGTSDRAKGPDRGRHDSRDTSDIDEMEAFSRIVCRVLTVREIACCHARISLPAL
jgi:hypothetical protein